jgi:hypothetical protein
LKNIRTLAVISAVLFALAIAATSQTWTPLAHQPGANVGAMLLLRDGRVLVHEEQSGNSRNWRILTARHL